MPDYPNGLNELLPLDFSTPYGCSKGAADQYVRDWARLFGMRTVVFRHSTIYGGRQFASFDQGWIGWFCQKALEQKRAYDIGMTPEPFTIAGTGKQVRDILHASDLVNLYQAAFNHGDDLRGEIFNILSEQLGIPPLSYTRTPRRSSDQDCFIADIGKANSSLCWKPNTSKEDGIAEILKWSKSLLCK
jgi:CDP-paratose 2-epimerase